MQKLTEDMQRIVREQKLGFVATVNEDGTPNLSPKATFVVIDDDHLMFGDIRSPYTVQNLVKHPSMEVNFVDPFARKGFRAKGKATYIARDTSAFDDLLPHFDQDGVRTTEMNGIVTLQVEQAMLVTSPAYDRGAIEEDIRKTWLAYFSGLNPY